MRHSWHRFALTVFASFATTVGLFTGAAPAHAAPPVPPEVLAWRNSDLTPQQWGLHAIHAPETWWVSTGTGVKVAIVDSGTDITHPDLAGRVVDGYRILYNGATAPRIIAMKARTSVDTDGHGTHVSGIVAANRDGHGTTGVAPDSQIVPINVTELFRARAVEPFVDGLILSLDAAKANKVRVVNLSLGGAAYEQSSIGPAVDKAEARLCAKIADLRANNIITVVSAGNDGEGGNPASFPGNCAAAFEVGSIGPNLAASAFSTFDPSVDISAPGGSVLSTVLDKDYAFYDGTSMAAPQVTGAVALLAAAHPDWTADQIVARLESTARDYGTPGTDPVYGAGLLDTAAALNLPTAAPTVVDVFALYGRFAVNDAEEGMAAWNAPLTANITGYTVTVLNRDTGKRVSADLPASAVRLPQSVPLNGRYFVHVVAHRTAMPDIDGGWVVMPYLAEPSSATAPKNFVVQPVPSRSTATTVTYRMTWTASSEIRYTESVRVAYGTDVTGESVLKDLPVKTTSTFLTVPRTLLAEDGQFYVAYIVTSDGMATYSTVGHRGAAQAYVAKTDASGTPNVYRVTGAVNQTAEKALSPVGGLPVTVQIRNKQTKKLVSASATRLEKILIPTWTTDIVSYQFSTWAKLPKNYLSVNEMRLVTKRNGKYSVTAWTPMNSGN